MTRDLADNKRFHARSVLLQPIFNIFVCMYACIYNTFCMLECVDTGVPEIPTMFTQVWV